MIGLAIRRPVGTLLAAIGLMLGGCAAFLSLQVSPLPQIDFPVIQVMAQLPGASPQTMAATVATPLERRLGVIAGISEMHSSSSLGATEIELEFTAARDINSAARDVQAAIAAARADLPANLVSSPVYHKANPTDAPILIIALTSRSLTQGALYAATNSILVPRLSQLSGVGLVSLRGSSLPGVRVQAQPRALAAMGVSLEQVRRAITDSNVNLPKGLIEDHGQQISLYANDQLQRAADFQNIPVAFRQGRLVRLCDVARISDSIEDVHSYGTADGEPAVVLLVYKQAGANIVATTDRVKSALPALRAALPPDVRLTFGGDRSATIRAALADTELTLVLGVVLLIGVVFAFLHGWRAVLVPALTVLASLAGTLVAMYLLGYSLNNLSLLALTIAAGFVIDDAVVVLENTTRHLERGSSRIPAAWRGAREVAFTVLSMSASLLAVFLPLLFLPGIAGALVHEFAMTLALAITLSLVLSLTFTPMLCACLLTIPPRTPHPLLAVRNFYSNSLRHALRRPRILLAVLLSAIVLNGLLFATVPKGLFPEQDSGLILGKIHTDEGISFEQLKKRMRAVEGILRTDPAVATVVTFANGEDFTTATVFVRLEPLARRKSARVFMTRVQHRLARLPGTTLSMFSIQDLFAEGGQSRGEFQVTLLGDDTDTLYAHTQQLVERLKKDPHLSDVSTERQSATRLTFTAERTLLSRWRLTPADLDAVMYDAFGQRQISTIFDAREQYHVILEADPDILRSYDPISSLNVSLPGGAATREAQIPVTAFGHLLPGTMPTQVHHLGQGVADPISFNVANGHTLSEALNAIDEHVRALHLPQSTRLQLMGSADHANSSGSGSSSTLWLLIGSLGTVYLVLGMLYESYAQPITILSTLPSAGIGALLALQAFSMELTVVALIGVILVTGIVMKNAIMMIDFALDAQRTRHLSPLEAIHAACLERLRPILMTTFASLFGAIPMILATGAGSELRRPLGVAIAGGLIVSQLLTLYTTPVVYLMLERKPPSAPDAAADRVTTPERTA